MTSGYRGPGAPAENPVGMHGWLVARVATVYIEVLRNIPLLLQLFFWYFAVLRALPTTNTLLVSAIGVVLATLAFWVIGAIWYGVLFSDIWMAENRVIEADFEGQSPMWMMLGILISLLAVIGIGKVMAWRGVTDIGGAVMTAISLWVFFAVSFVMYDLAYLPAHSTTMFFVDIGHLLVGWVVSAAVLSFFK